MLDIRSLATPSVTTSTFSASHFRNLRDVGHTLLGYVRDVGHTLLGYALSKYTYTQHHKQFLKIVARDDLCPVHADQNDMQDYVQS